MMALRYGFHRLPIVLLLHHMSNYLVGLNRGSCRHARLGKVCNPVALVVLVLGQRSRLGLGFVDLRIRLAFLYPPRFCLGYW